MSSPIIGTLLAFVLGAAISYLNYLISRSVLKAKPSLFPAASILRQLLCIGYLVLLYFAAKLTPWEPFALLIGGALGVTVPMLYFTRRLLDQAKPVANNSAESQAASEKSDSADKSEKKGE